MAGYDIKRLPRSGGSSAPKLEPSVSPNPSPEETPLPIDILDLALQDLMRRKPKIEFVQIGAHDGVTYDPIHSYVTKHDWAGVVVEPQPKIFAQLASNYSGLPRVRLENCAVSDKDGEAELFMFVEDRSLPYHATMLASFRREIIAGNTHGYKGEIVGIRVPTLTPISLLRKNGLQTIDVLQIDTEGHDHVILMEFLKAGIFPSLIHFESAGCGPQERKGYEPLLAKANYGVMTVGIDTLAYRQTGGGNFAERALLPTDRGL
jgi:FkbM family methyltransferase